MAPAACQSDGYNAGAEQGQRYRFRHCGIFGADFEVRPLGMDGETLRVAIASRAAPEPATIPDAAAVEAAPTPPAR